jgi:hypothetical protein
VQQKLLGDVLDIHKVEVSSRPGQVADVAIDRRKAAVKSVLQN